MCNISVCMYSNVQIYIQPSKHQLVTMLSDGEDFVLSKLRDGGAKNK